MPLPATIHCVEERLPRFVIQSGHCVRYIGDSIVSKVEMERVSVGMWLEEKVVLHLQDLRVIHASR